MSRTRKDSYDKKYRTKSAYKRPKSLAQEFLDEYMKKNNESDQIYLHK
jgi:hypothetical protein